MSAGGSGSGAMNDLKLFILIIIVLWIVWYLIGHAGGSKPFIKPAAPLDTGETYGPNDTFVDPKAP